MEKRCDERETKRKKKADQAMAELTPALRYLNHLTWHSSTRSSRWLNISTMASAADTAMIMTKYAQCTSVAKVRTSTISNADVLVQMVYRTGKWSWVLPVKSSEKKGDIMFADSTYSTTTASAKAP